MDLKESEIYLFVKWFFAGVKAKYGLGKKCPICRENCKVLADEWSCNLHKHYYEYYNGRHMGITYNDYSANMTRLTTGDCELPLALC